MKITLNGEERRIEQTDLAEFVLQLALPQQRIAIELNGSVVPRSEWPQTRVRDGDQVEIVHFVGGG